MISVVLPTYNEAASIQEVLRRASAALAKVGEPYELIVVDDASPDGTAELAESLSASCRCALSGGPDGAVWHLPSSTGGKLPVVMSWASWMPIFSIPRKF